MRVTNLDEVETVCRVNSSSVGDESPLQVCIFAQSAVSEWEPLEQLSAPHQCRPHDEIGKSMLTFGEPAHDDIAVAQVKVVSLLADEIRI